MATASTDIPQLIVVSMKKILAFAFAFFIQLAHASNGYLAPYIEVRTFGESNIGSQSFSLNLGRSFTVESIVSISGPFGSLDPIPTVDVYVGMVTPSGKIKTWIADRTNVPGSNPDLQARGLLLDGVRPYFSNHSAPSGFFVYALERQVIGYRFAATDESGLYTIFVLLARAGVPPDDPGKWVGIGSSLLWVYPQ